MSDAITAAVRKLTEGMEAASAEAIDLPATIALLVKRAAQWEVDLHITLGTLVEGIAYTVSTSIPEQSRRKDCRARSAAQPAKIIASGYRWDGESIG